VLQIWWNLWFTLMMKVVMHAEEKIVVRALLRVVILTAAYSCLPIPFGPIVRLEAKNAQNESDKSSIRVKVELVNVPLVVRDTKGKHVLDLGLKDFRIFDNGVKQEIESVEAGGAPISAVIVIETSSRILGLMPLIQRTGILFTKTILGETGEAAVFGYNDNVDEQLDFTSDPDAIERTVSTLQEGTSGACLYDALSQAASVLQNRPAYRRKVIIALAESTDTGSEAKLGEVMRQLELANIAVYGVDLSLTAAEWHGEEKQASAPLATMPGTFGLSAFPGTAQTPWSVQQFSGNMNLKPFARWTLWGLKHATGTARNPLEMVAAKTGGLSESTFDDNSIEVAIDQIGADLSAQYTLSYDLARSGAGGYHKIKVEVVDHPELKVRSRSGYYFPPL
jgi:VWFA-related protein